MMCSPPSAMASARNLRAVSSNSIRSARSSVLRHTRDTSDTTTMPTMKKNEMAIPSGFSITLSTRAYSSTRVTSP